MDMQHILNGGYFTLIDDIPHKFQLKFENWNDYGYYTLYGLWLITPALSIKIADIRIFNYSQKFGENPVWISTPNVFISNLASAERLLIFLSYEERIKLIQMLNIRFDSKELESEPAFLKSVLRDKTLVVFKSQQETIKVLVKSNMEVSRMVIENLSQIKMLPDDI